MPTLPNRISQKAARFTESVIREMTRLAIQYDAINLAQGFPNFPAPQDVKDAACRAIQEDINQYAITWGSPRLRQAVADKYQRFYNWEIDPETEITVACGTTECMMASILGGRSGARLRALLRELRSGRHPCRCFTPLRRPGSGAGLELRF